MRRRLSFTTTRSISIHRVFIERMSTFPNSPRLLEGGIVLVDPDTAAVQRIISLWRSQVDGLGPK